MNMRSRQFRNNPHAGAVKTAHATKRLAQLLRSPPTQPLAVYVELDCWHLDQVHTAVQPPCNDHVTTM